MSTCAKCLPPILVLIALLALLAPMACRFAWDYSTASRRHQQFQSMFVWPRGWRVRQQRTPRSTAQLSTAEPSSPSPGCRLSMVHLITHANDIYTQGDRTIIFWTKTLQCGDNIQAEKKVEAIRVTRSGMYFIYNQVTWCGSHGGKTEKLWTSVSETAPRKKVKLGTRLCLKMNDSLWARWCGGDSEHVVTQHNKKSLSCNASAACLKNDPTSPAIPQVWCGLVLETRWPS